MNSKRFVLGISGVVVGIVLLIYSLTWILPDMYYMTAGEYGSWLQPKDFTQSKHENVDVLLLGDSRMKIGVDPAILSESAYNMALSGCNPIDMYYSLQRYLKNNDAPKLVIIGYAPTHLTHMENYTERSLYFHYLSEDEVQEANENIRKYDGKDMTGEYIKYKYRSPAIYLTGVLHNLRKNAKVANEVEYAQLAEQRGAMFLEAVKAPTDQVRPEETKAMDFSPLASLDFYLRETIQLCQTNGIPVMIIQFPMGEYGIEKLKESGYLVTYKTYMEDIRDQYGIPVQTDIPMYTNDMFADNSHLNRNGNRVFSNEIKRIIKQYVE